MITLETIVESLKIQLKPHLTDDVIVHDEWLAQMVHESRAALMRTLFTAGDNFIAFYQEFIGTSVDMNANFKKLVLPFKIMEGIGKKNILYLGPTVMSVPQYHYCSFEELMNYAFHRYGNNNAAYANMGSFIQIKSISNAELLLKCVVDIPTDVPGYDYQTSPYPIGANNERQLEIITFQHIASKLGMPVDLLNNGMDETKNASVGKQQQPQEQPQ